MHLFWLTFLPAIGYQVLAIIASLRQLRRAESVRSDFSPGVSVLKPLRGLDSKTFEAFVSQVHQSYPTFEIIFGAQCSDDPAVGEVYRLQRLFPDARTRLVIGSANAANRKVGTLMEIAREAQYPIWVVNDSDIEVDPQYLSRIVAPLEEESIGLVTCLYRPRAYNTPATWEALGIATDFMPSALVAQLLGVRDFGLGSTLAFRAEDLRAAGGFEAIADYLADDYQLARHITASGKKAWLSTYIVETGLNDSTWLGIWSHQIRWARTIRTSKGNGYVGLPITHAGAWAVIAALTGAWAAAILLIALRWLSAIATGWFVLRSQLAARLFWLAPAWDLYAFAVWAACYAGNTVRWRDRSFKIDKHGRIQS